MYKSFTPWDNFFINLVHFQYKRKRVSNPVQILIFSINTIKAVKKTSHDGSFFY